MSGVEKMKRGTTMNLRAAADDEPEGTKPFSFRCPTELKEYLEEASSWDPKRTKTEVLTSALELDRDLNRDLRSDQTRIAAYAAANGLRMSRDLGVLLAKLVKEGLESWERSDRPKRGRIK